MEEEALSEGGGIVCGELERFKEGGWARENGGYVADVSGGEGGVAAARFFFWSGEERRDVKQSREMCFEGVKI